MTEPEAPRLSFWNALLEQRWDDHRLYHHSRINQSLHLISACCFLSAYVLIFINPVAAALIGWFCAMLSRQIGHFFFEPKTYDRVNRATHAHKESIKVGYNLRRKVILLSVWAAVPAMLSFDSTLFGIFPPANTGYEFLHSTSVSWLCVGGAAILGRSLYLWVTEDSQTGAVWFFKILTDPFHDIKIYHRSPLYLLRGDLYDPMTDDWGPKADLA